MSIEQTNVVDFASIDDRTGSFLLTISDHLQWDKEEGTHLQLLQDKLNAYLRFIESGEILQQFPEATGRTLVINLVGQYPLSAQASLFLEKARAAMRNAGYSLEFRLMPTVRPEA